MRFFSYRDAACSVLFLFSVAFRFRGKVLFTRSRPLRASRRCRFVWQVFFLNVTHKGNCLPHNLHVIYYEIYYYFSGFYRRGENNEGGRIFGAEKAARFFLVGLLTRLVCLDRALNPVHLG